MALVLRIGGASALLNAVLAALSDAAVRSAAVEWLAIGVAAAAGLGALAGAALRPSRALALALFLSGVTNVTLFGIEATGRGQSGYSLFLVLIAAGAGWVLGRRGLAVVLGATAAGTVAMALAALPAARPGATDLLLAPAAATFVGLLILRQRELVRVAFARVRQLADRDPLTGIANRRSLVASLASEVARARREDGHAAGDEALRSAAAAMLDELRGMDELGRLGGDEFGIILPGTDRAEGERVAERVRRRLGRTTVAGARLAACVGLAAFPEDGEAPDELLDRADARLLEAKRGRTRRPAEAPVPS